jgi:hypothetical protein
LNGNTSVGEIKKGIEVAGGALPATSESRAHQPEWEDSTRTVELKVGIVLVLCRRREPGVFCVSYLLSKPRTVRDYSVADTNCNETGLITVLTVTKGGYS